jgi:molybdopterin-guanine dinucleotide biosynthesis protein A
MNGLVLVGGYSRRMGQPKGLLEYQGRPQYQVAADQLDGLCERVFVSCRAEQASLFTGYPLVLDDSRWGDIGPMNGVLSAFFSNQSPKAWFVLGCDYPLIGAEDLEELAQARDPERLATVFINPNTQIPEPLVGIYEPKARDFLQKWLQSGHESLRRFLEAHDAQTFVPSRPERLKSADTPEDFEQLRSANN